MTNKDPNPRTPLDSVKHENQLNKSLLKMRPLPRDKIATSPFHRQFKEALSRNTSAFIHCVGLM